MSDARRYQIALSLVPKVGNVLSRQLLAYFGSARAVFEAPKGKLLKVSGIGPTLAESIADPAVLRRADATLERAVREGAHLLHWQDDAYPRRLREIPDAPTLLYRTGPATLDAERVVAVVGTRKATEYGRQVTEEIVRGLATYGCTIVSGLAYGIDIAAHKAALQHGLPTVGVMASGLDIIYPRVHARTAQQMAERGALVTENNFGTKPDAPLFPARNRIIAGLSDAVVVVEAANKGGALITAHLAQDYNREVLAVPGDWHRTYSVGCNRLIRNHVARILTDPADVAYAMNWELTAARQQQLALDLAALSDEAQRVVLLLGGASDMMIDELRQRSQIPIGQLSTLLLELEFGGWVKALPGKKFTLVHRR